MPGTNTSISVIIPTHNHAEFITQALDSVLKQTIPVLEIIVINDGSTDNTREILEHYRDRITYVETEKTGPARARNLGISLSRGDYIAFLDSDDFWVEDKLEKQIKLFESDESVGLVYGKMYVLDRNTNQITRIQPGQLHTGDIFDEILVNNCIYTPSVIIRRSVIDQIGYFHHELFTAEDTNFFMRIAKHFRIMAVDEPVFYRRFHNNNISEHFGKHVGTILNLDLISEQYPEHDRKVYPPMMQAYRVRGMQLLRDSFNAGQYTACRDYARALLRRGVLLKASLMMYAITSLPCFAIDSLRKLRRQMS